jgi:hypothetical protein
MAKRKQAPLAETAEQIAARLKAADTARNEARGDALSEATAEKTRWRETLALVYTPQCAAFGGAWLGENL